MTETFPIIFQDSFEYSFLTSLPVIISFIIHFSIYSTPIISFNSSLPFNPFSPLNIFHMKQEVFDQALELDDKLQIFHIRGRDKRGRKILRITGKFLLGGIVSTEIVKKYLEEKILPELEKQPFVVVYLHTDVEKSENFIVISALRSVYDAIPIKVRDNLEAVYFIHPGLQARLFLATFGRFIFSGGLYWKLRYISRIDYLWDHVRRNEIEIPEFVYGHDEDLEYRPMMDYGLESDHPRVYDSPAVDSSVEMYSTRCIS